MDFGERLKKCRKEMSLSQKEFGLKIGVAESTVSLYESNKRFPDVEILKKIASILNVSVDYLLGRTVSKAPSSQISRSEKELVSEDQQLLDMFHQLNSEGRKTVISNVKWLASQDEYRTRIKEQGTTA